MIEGDAAVGQQLDRSSLQQILPWEVSSMPNLHTP